MNLRHPVDAFLRRQQGGEDPKGPSSSEAIFCKRAINYRLIQRRIFIGHFPQKNPVINGSFAGRDLRFETFRASLAPCVRRATSNGFLCLIYINIYICVHIYIYIYIYIYTYIYLRTTCKCSPSNMRQIQWHVYI